MSRSTPHNHSSRNAATDNRSLRQRMSQDLQLRGMAPRTHNGYLREVRKLACYYNCPPDQLSEQQVGDYLRYLINDCNFAAGSLSVAHSGIKFFYTVTLPLVRRADAVGSDHRRQRQAALQPSATVP